MPGGHLDQGPAQGIHVGQHFVFPTVGDLNAHTNEANGRASTQRLVGRYAEVQDFPAAGRSTLYYWDGTVWIPIGSAAIPTDSRYVMPLSLIFAEPGRWPVRGAKEQALVLPQLEDILRHAH